VPPTSPLGELLEVVAGAEAPARALQHDDADVVVVVRLLDRGPDLRRHASSMAFEPLGPVEVR
jgi:hypothetical protein